MRCNNLIINGDLFDSKHFHRLKKQHWKILSIIRKLSNKINITFITGNHDFYADKYFTSLLGIKTQNYLKLNINNKKYYITHGHMFDYLMSPKFLWISNLTSEIYYFICKNNFIKNNFNEILHEKTKQIFKIDRQMKKHAIEYAKEYNYNYIICGHTHFPEIYKENNIIYANSGCFTVKNPTYLSIDNFGNLFLNKI